MPTDPAQVAAIADGLSYAQSAAMRGVYAWSSPWEQEKGEAELYRLGLWGPHGGRSPLAIAVRAHLLAAKDTPHD